MPYLPSIEKQHSDSRRHLRHGNNEQIRFTKLKGVLVNNLLKEYHKQTNRAGDAAVYNRAVLEVEKILRNGKLTEGILRQMQANFAKGDSENRTSAPLLRAKDIQKDSIAKSPDYWQEGRQSDIKVIDANRMEPQAFSQGSTIEEPASASRLNLPSVSSPRAIMKENSIVSSKSSRSPSKGKQLDAWSLITLHNDTTYLEEQKRLKDRQISKKTETREHLLQQIEFKKKQRETLKAQEQLEAQELQAKLDRMRIDQEKEAQLRREKQNAAREFAAVEKKEAAARHQAETERRLQEEQLMLSEFQRQIDAERARKEQMIIGKHRQYLVQQEENAKELEKKLLKKQKEREENEQLFQLQISMEQKQEQIRAEKDAERQEKLKQSERMAGNINNRANELIQQEETRRQKVQQDFLKRDAEREKMRLERKKALENETMAVLEEQIRQHNAIKQKQRQDIVEYAREQAKIAQEIADAAAKERKDRHMRKNKFRQQLDSQIATKQEQKVSEALGMNGTELRINSHLLHEVIKQRPDEVDEDLVSKVEQTSVFSQSSVESPPI